MHLATAKARRIYIHTVDKSIQKHFKKTIPYKVNPLPRVDYFLNWSILEDIWLPSRENDGKEREAQGVGRDMSCPQKLFLTQRKSRFSGGSLFSETSACSLASLSGS